MQKWRSFWRERSLFWQYLCGLVLLSFLIIVLVTGMMFFTSQSTLRQQLSAAEEHYLSSVGESISTHLQQARQNAGFLASSDPIRQAILKGQSQWSELLYDCSQFVRQGLSSNTCIAGICLIGGNEILLKSERNYQMPEYDQQMVDMMVWHAGEVLIPWRMNSGRREYLYLSILRPIDTLEPPNNVGGVLVTLDMEKVAQRVFTGSSGLFYALDREGRIILSNDTSAFLSDLPALREAADGAAEVRLDEARYVVSHAPFDSFTLYHLTPHRQFYGSLRQYSLIALLILLACTVLAVPLSLLLARRAYRPVRNVFIQLSGLEDGSTEAGPVNELEKASNAIVHIYETIDAYREDMDASALRSCLTDGAGREKELDRVRQCLHDLPYHRLVVVGVPEEPGCVQRATDIASSYISGSYGVTSVSTGDGTITLVVSSAQPIEEDKLRLLLENAAASLTRLLPQTVLFSVSPGVLDVDGLHEAYETALRRMATSALYAHSGCIRPVVESPVDSSLADALCNCALRQEQEAFLEGLDALCDACQCLTAEAAFEQLALLSVRIQQHQAALRPADRLPLFSAESRRLRALRSHPALVAHFMNLFIANAAPPDAAQDAEAQRLAELSQTYINQHFSESTLSAQEVADALHISVSHFSRILKKHTGKTFLELVTACRMEKAAQLLVDSPDLSINALSHACGFSSPSYFTASFKKWFGVTPSDYRSRSGT